MALGRDFSHAGRQQRFLLCLFTLLGKALRFQCRGADGRGGQGAWATADIEQQFMYALRTFGLQHEGQSFAMRAFADGAAAPQSAEACAFCLRAYYANDASLVAAVFEAFCDIMLAGGDLSESERLTVWSVGRAFDLPSDAIDQAVTARRRDRGYTQLTHKRLLFVAVEPLCRGRAGGLQATRC